MGKTAYSGPVYGAKATLMTCGPLTGAASGTTGVVARTIVPQGETWYVTEMICSASTNSSNFGVKLKVKGTSTSASYPGPGPDPNFPTGNAGTVIAFVSGASTAGFNAVAYPTTPTAGEYEGYAIPANSSVRVISSGAAAPSALSVVLRGFTRFLNSTRAEA